MTGPRPRREARQAGAGSTRELAATRDRALVTSALAAVFARVVIALSALVALGVAARQLTAAELGVVSVLTALTVYLTFGDFGTGSLLMTKLPVAHAQGDRAEMRRLVGAALSAMSLVAAVGLLFGTASVFVFPWQDLLGAGSLSGVQVQASISVFVVTGALRMVATVGGRVLMAMQRGATVRLFGSAGALLTVAAVLACALVEAPVWAYLAAFTVPLTMVELAQLGLVLRSSPQLRPSRREIRVGEGARFLRSGLGYAVLSLGWAISYALDALIISAVLGAASAAVFAIAVRLFSLVVGVITTAGQQMWPAMAEAMARGDLDWVRHRFRHSVVVVAVVSSAACLALVVLGPAFSRVWVGEDLAPPLSLFVLLAVWTVYLTVMTQYSYLLFARGRIRVLTVLGVVGAAVNLGASIVLTQRLGLVGPVVGSLLAAALVQFLPTVLMTRRLLRQVVQGAVGGGQGPTHSVHDQGVDRVT